MKRVVAIAACGIEPCRLLQHAELDAVRYAGFEVGAGGHHHAIRIRAGRRRGQDLARADLPDPLLARGDGQRIHGELHAARLPAADRAGAGGGLGRPRDPTPRRRARASCRTRCLSNCSRPGQPPVAKKPAPAKKKPKPAPRPAPTAMAPRAAAVARPRAGLALAAGALRPARSLPIRRLAAADGRPLLVFAFLDTARTGSLKRGPVGRLAQRESVPFTRERS